MNTRRKYDLVCFDVDGTLITHPSDKVIWEILNQRFIGDDSVNEERYRMYRTGEITYDDWVRLDVSGWIDAGATRDQVVEAVQEFRVYEGALETVNALKNMGVRLAMISGTIDIVIDILLPDHPFDEVYANSISFGEDGRINGWKATPYDLFGKQVAIRDLAGRYGVPLERTAFVGDGENDVPVAGVAGFVVAFNPRSDELEKLADRVLKNQSMLNLLDILI